MKKSRIVLLTVIYGILLLFTLAMEWLGVREPALRAAVNLGTLGMAAVGGLFSVLIYRGGASKGEEKPSESGERDNYVFDRERYLAFAAEHDFTRRETEVGLLVANGYSNLRIAEELFISETTVKKHITHIYEKSGIQGRRAFAQSFCKRDEAGADSSFHGEKSVL